MGRRNAAILAAVVVALSGALEQARAQSTLTVAKVAEDFALMMGDFGKTAGTYRRNGIEVEIALITQAKMVQAVVAGSIEVSLASGATLAFAAKGAPLKAVAALSGPPTILGLVLRPHHSVTSTDALPRRIVAVTQFGA